MTQQGTLVIKNPTGDVSFTIQGLTSYTITATVENLTASSSNPTTIKEGGTATLTFTADGTNYKVPESMPTITGATGTYTRTSDTECSITLSEPTSDVSFTVSGESAETLIGTWVFASPNTGIQNNFGKSVNNNENAVSPFSLSYYYNIDSTISSATRTYTKLAIYDANTDNTRVNFIGAIFSGSYYSYSFVFNYGSTISRTITITGGSDVTNATLISWFKTHATKQ